jgi:3-hydroxyisobutyrate dehydrogenase
MSRIGFIGLGMMGRPMAHLLHGAGHSLVVRDVNRDAEAGFVTAHSGTAVGANGRAFADCDVVLTMLPNSDIVDAVVKELAPHLKHGACVIEMSSSDPNRTRALAQHLHRYEVSLLDAPVSGGVKKAVTGSLAVMVGGDEATLERYKPILEILGNAITLVGPVGAGHAMKALNNYVSAAALIATAEAMHVGSAFGIEESTIVDVLNSSTGKNNTTENKALQFMLSGAFNSGFSLALQAKDVALAAALGRSLDLPMELAQKVDSMISHASEALGPTADHTEVYKLLGRT